MLPDYPKIKARLEEVYRERIRHVQDLHLGIFSEIPPSQVHEGGKHILFREDGSSDEMEPKRVEAEAPLKLNYQEIEKLDAKEVTKMLDALAKGLAEQKAKIIIAAMDEAITSIGNVTDSSKSALEQFFEATEKRMIDFDDDSRPGPTHALVGSEEMAQKLRQVMEQIKADPDLRLRYENLIEKKKGEWRDREAARNLVE